MSRQPERLTQGEAVRSIVRAAHICDPEGADSKVAAFVHRVPFHDTDTPMAAVPDLRRQLAGHRNAVDPDGESAALAMTAATAVYFAGRQVESTVDQKDVLRLAASEEFEGAPPQHVSAWLAERGVRI
jgi:hypothetical protein